MKSFSIWLIEQRKNPELNPKISAYSELLKYKNDPDIYISMTDDMQYSKDDKHKGGSKIGINPKTSFNTPAGMFCYPLAEALEKYNIHDTKSLKSLPFAGDRPYVYILRAKDSDGFINDMYKDYTSKNYDKDYKTLRDIFFDYGETFKDDESIVQNIRNIDAPLNDDVEDMLDSLAVESNGKNSKDIIQKAWVIFVKIALESRKEQNPIMAFWQMSRLLSILITGSKEGNKMSVKWNSILRKCGYTGFADKSGRGYIHPAEPMQAMFLSRDAFTVVDRLLNKTYDDKILIKTFDQILHTVISKPNTLPAFLSFLATNDELELTKLRFTTAYSNLAYLSNVSPTQFYSLISKTLTIKVNKISEADKLYDNTRKTISNFIGYSNETVPSTEVDKFLDILKKLKEKETSFTTKINDTYNKLKD